MAIVYAISPYKGIDGDYVKNTIYAKEIAKAIFDRGDIPIMPHLLFPQFMDDRDPTERQKALEMGKQLLEIADKVEVHTRYAISKGMEGEILYAEELGKPIEYRRYLPHELR